MKEKKHIGKRLDEYADVRKRINRTYYSGLADGKKIGRSEVITWLKQHISEYKEGVHTTFNDQDLIGDLIKEMKV